MFKISDNLHSSFSNYTNFKCTYIFANETTFAILATYLWPLTVCAGWSEPLLVPYTILFEISCRRSNKDELQSLIIVFILANSAEPDEMLHNAASRYSLNAKVLVQG